MIIEKTPLQDLLILTPKVHGDNRGFFLEAWRENLFEEMGLPKFVQDNHAFSAEAGTFRGMHFQKGDAAQAKFVWVSRGAVLDVLLDMRKDSPTYGKAHAEELTAKNFKRLFVPRGFAHGYLVLEENTDFHYKVDNYYSAKDEGGISHRSKEIDIDWEKYYKGEILLSEKDKILPLFEL